MNHPQTAKQLLYIQKRIRVTIDGEGKIKFRKPGFKVVRDLLTKKWIVIKKDRRVRDLVEVAMLLETLGVSL
jgi:hypothetical protein